MERLEEIRQLKDGNIVQVMINPVEMERYILPVRICNYETLLEANEHIFWISFYEDFQILNFKLFCIESKFKLNEDSSMSLRSFFM